MHGVPTASRLIVSAALTLAFVSFVAILPNSASAQTVSPSVETSQLLPPGQTICPVITVTSIEPHVYAGMLESFDVTIADASGSYVGILAQVGNTPLSLDYVTRWAGEPSGLRIHVDTPDMPATGGLPVTLTLLSSPPGAPTCITTISFQINAAEMAAPHTAPATYGNGAMRAPHTSNTQRTTMIPRSAGKRGGTNVQPATSKAASSALGGSTTAEIGEAVFSASTMKFFDSICTGSNAYRLWFVLLAIYIIIVAIVVFAEPWFLESSVVGSTAAILIPLILLLAFWYLSATCRAASWIPVVACVIAIVGLFLAFREYELPPLLPAPNEQ